MHGLEREERREYLSYVSFSLLFLFLHVLLFLPSLFLSLSLKQCSERGENKQTMKGEGSDLRELIAHDTGFCDISSPLSLASISY